MTVEFLDAYEKSLEYFDNDELAANVFVTKYALSNKRGDFLEESPYQMHRRLASEFARIEKKYPNPMSYEEIHGLFENFKYVVPQGSPIRSAAEDAAREPCHDRQAAARDLRAEEAAARRRGP